MAVIQRGRKSAAEKLVQQSLRSGVVELPKPDASYNLTDDESDVWRSIVSAMPADYFAPTHYPMLCQLCRHVVASNRIAQLVEQTYAPKVIDQELLQDLLKMQATETNAIMRLERSMRLTHQSIHRAEHARKMRPLNDAGRRRMIASPLDSSYDDDE